MQVLVLGGTGFVGQNVVEVLRESEFRVFNASTASGYDLRKLVEVKRAINEFQPEVIINCAAHVGSLNYVTEFAADVINNNAQMILSLYEAVAKLNKEILVINPIANCSYPGDAVLYKEDSWMDGPIHPSVLSYGNSRRLLWATSECYKMQYGVKTINFFVPNMYGEYDSTDPNKAHALNALIGKFVKAEAESKSLINIWGTGKVVREWLYAKDFARIIETVLNSKSLQNQLTEAVNIAQKSGLTITELVNIINSDFDNKFNLEYDTSKPDGAPKKVMDDKNFRIVFPEFRFTSFEQGIKNTIAYYKTQLPY